jgi:hypothetical protein
MVGVLEEMIWKFLLRMGGFFVFGISILLFVVGLFLVNFQSNLENFDGIVNKSVDNFFDDNREEILVNFGVDYEDECENGLISAEDCEMMDVMIDDAFILAKEESKESMSVLFEEIGFEAYDTDRLFAISIIFFVIAFFLVFYGHRKSFVRTFRGFSIQTGLSFLLLYIALSELVKMKISDLYSMINMPMEMSELAIDLVQVLVAELIFYPIQQMLLPFLIISISGFILFVMFLILAWQHVET